MNKQLIQGEFGSTGYPSQGAILVMGGLIIQEYSGSRLAANTGVNPAGKKTACP